MYPALTNLTYLGRLDRIPGNNSMLAAIEADIDSSVKKSKRRDLLKLNQFRERKNKLLRILLQFSQELYVLLRDAAIKSPE
jgi:hypothetical protein